MKTKTLYFTRFKIAAYAALIALALTGTLSCQRGVEPEPEPTAEGETLSEIYAPYFRIGAAVAGGEYGYDTFRANDNAEAVIAEFSSLTAENAMKAGVIHPTANSWNYAAADKIVSWATARDIGVRGHALVWHQQTGTWMFTDGGTQEEKKAFARANMKAHIEAMLARYGSRVEWWDVVNEAISDSSTGSIYRTDSPWYQAYGDATFIRDAFAFARAANPDVKLYYNDYSMVSAGKRARTIQMIDELDLVRDGLIDGVGMQSHWQIDSPSTSEIQSAIDDFSALGIDVQITELDIVCSSAELPLLAARYAEIFRVLRDNSDKISSVTLWGVADDHTWLTDFHGFTNYPLLWDANFEPKDAYRAVTEF